MKVSANCQTWAEQTLENISKSQEDIKAERVKTLAQVEARLKK